MNIRPTSKKSLEGTDHYDTLPVIYDPSTGVYLADSMVIANYLDKTCLNTPSLFPNKTVGMHYAFLVAIGDMVALIWEFTNLAAAAILGPPSKKYIWDVRERSFGKSLEGASPKGEYAVAQWTKLQANFETVASWYARTDDIGLYFIEDEILWADIVMASYLAK